MHTSPNPYNYTLPASGDMLFGRDEEIEKILQLLLSSLGDSVAIVGGRRMGKTSLLEAIHRTLESKQNEEIKYLDLMPIPIAIDFRGETPQSLEDFYFYLGTETQKALQKWLGDNSLKTFEIPPHSPSAQVMGDFLVEGSNLFVSQKGVRFRLIVLLENCEWLVKQDWSINLYETLRYLLAGRQTRSLIKVVISSSHRFITQIQQNGSPLRELLHYHWLQAFNKFSIRQLVTMPTNFKLPLEIIEIIEGATGGHPYLIQYIMSNLLNLDIASVTQADVKQIIQNFPAARNSFAYWYEDLNKTSWEIYYIIAKTDHAIMEQEIRSIFQGTPADLIYAIQALRYYGLITKKKNGSYLISCQMYKEWFEANISEQFRHLSINKKKEETLEKKEENEIYDVFLSYSHSDEDWIEDIAQKLEEQEGLRVWFDKWILVPGEPWIQSIAIGLSQAKACAVFLGKDMPDGWFRQEIGRAKNRQAGNPAFRVIPVLLPDASEDHAVDFLNLNTWVDFRKPEKFDDAFHRLVSGIKGMQPKRGSK